MSQHWTQGQRIRETRIDCRFTQEYVAKQLGTTKQAIYKYEADLVKNIPIDKLLHLAQLFQCSPAWLQGLTDDRGTAPEGPLPLPSTPSGIPHYAKKDPEQVAIEQVMLYRDLMDLLLRLSPSECQSVLQFAQFLHAGHMKPAEEEYRAAKGLDGEE